MATEAGTQTLGCGLLNLSGFELIIQSRRFRCGVYETLIHLSRHRLTLEVLELVPLGFGGFFWANRMNKIQQYEYEKARWVHMHPSATPAQIEAAFKAIAQRLGV